MNLVGREPHQRSSHNHDRPHRPAVLTAPEGGRSAAPSWGTAHGSDRAPAAGAEPALRSAGRGRTADRRAPSRPRREGRVPLRLGGVGRRRRRDTADLADDEKRDARFRQRRDAATAARDDARAALASGDPPLATLHTRLAVLEAASGLIELSGDRVSVTHFVESTIAALRSLGRAELETPFVRALALDAPPVALRQSIARSLRAYRAFADALKRWMDNPSLAGRLSEEDVAWAVFTWCDEPLEESTTRWRPSPRSAGCRHSSTTWTACSPCRCALTSASSSACARRANRAASPSPSSTPPSETSQHSSPSGLRPCAWKASPPPSARQTTWRAHCWPRARPSLQECGGLTLRLHLIDRWEELGIAALNDCAH